MGNATCYTLKLTLESYKAKHSCLHGS